MNSYAVPTVLVRIAIPLGWLAWALTFAVNMAQNEQTAGTVATVAARCLLWAAVCHVGLAGMRALFDIARNSERTANAAEKRGTPVKALP